MRATATLSATTARVTHVCNTRDPTGNARRTPASLRRAREGHAPRIARLGARIVHAMVDDDAPELPDYDVVTLGPLEGSAIALSAKIPKGAEEVHQRVKALICEGQGPNVSPHEPPIERLSALQGGRISQEIFGEVHADDIDAQLPQSQRVTAEAATEVQDPPSHAHLVSPSDL